MQAIRRLQDPDGLPLAFEMRVLLLSHEAAEGEIARRIGLLDGQVKLVDEVFTALSPFMEDPP